MTDEQIKDTFYETINKYLKHENITALEIESLARAYVNISDKIANQMDCFSKSMLDILKTKSIPVEPVEETTNE